MQSRFNALNAHHMENSHWRFWQPVWQVHHRAGVLIAICYGVVTTFRILWEIVGNGP